VPSPSLSLWPKIEHRFFLKHSLRALCPLSRYFVKIYSMKLKKYYGVGNLSENRKNIIKHKLNNRRITI
jgi:hypothetical protein